MKILMVGKAYHPHLGGVETVLRQLAEGMADRGHEVTVLCFGGQDADEMLEGVRVVRVRPLFRIGSAPVGWKFYRRYRALAAWAEVAHFHSPNPMGELSCLLAPLPPKTIVTYHGDAFRPRWLLTPYDAMMRRFLHRCSVVCTTSPNLLKNSRVLSKLNRGVKIIPIGIDLSRFTDISEEALQAAGDLVEGLRGFRVMFAGRFVYYKGIDILLKALAALNEEKPQSVSAFLVGTGPLEPEIRKFVADRDLQDQVRIVPPQPDEIYTALFRQADCFVLPSVYPVEAFGIVLLEAMAAGLPVISTELGTGTSWVNRDGETGLVVRPGDAASLAKALRLLAESPERSRHRGQAGRLRARELFTNENSLGSYISCCDA